MTDAKHKPRNRRDHSPKNKLRIILSRTINKKSCLLWKGTIFTNKQKLWWKYPAITYKNKTWRGNRLVLFLHTGELPSRKYALHKCDNSLCLNPKHLYWGTPKDNVRDSYSRGRARNVKVTSCPSGHPYKGDNLRIGKGNRRFCRSCAWYKNRGLAVKNKNIYE